MPLSNDVDTHLSLGRGLLERDGLLFTHGRDNGNEQVLSVVKALLDLLAQISFGDLDVVLGDTFRGHEIEETIINVDELVFSTADIGDVHVVRRRRDIFHLLASKDLGRRMFNYSTFGTRDRIHTSMATRWTLA